MPSIALDHLTCIDADPFALIEIASAADYDAICPFLHTMPQLPLMPQYDLIQNRADTTALRDKADDTGIGIDLAYPLAIEPGTQTQSLRPVFDCAAELGVRLLNTLVFDRDLARRAATASGMCDLGEEYGVKLAVEFYPMSALRSLDEAQVLLAAVARQQTLGLNIDLLHLIRSGGSPDDLGKIAPEAIFCAQVCDAPADIDPAEREYEASSNRLMPGMGQLDVAGFLNAIPNRCLVTVEVPQPESVVLQVSALTRARQALDSLRDEQLRARFRH